MKITSVGTIPLSVPLLPPSQGKVHPLDVPFVSYVLVRVETDEGLVGWGEISDGWGCEYPGVADALVTEALSRFAVGRDPADVADIVAVMWAWMRRRQGTTWLVAQAVSGVEIALWDVLGRSRGVPVSKLVGPPLRDRIPVYMGGNFLGQTDAAGHAEHYRPALERGVDTIKVRIGADWREGVEVLAGLHDLVGEGVGIGVDGNEAFQPKTALQIARAMAECGGAFFEEPVPRADRAGLARLVELSPVPIAYGEHVHTAAGFRELEEDGPLADVWQPDVTVMGGFLEARAAHALAAMVGRPISPHAATTPLGFAANLHSAAAAPTLTRVEYSATAIARLIPHFVGGEALALDAVVDGALPLPQGSGLGVEPDVTALQTEFPVRELQPVTRRPAFYLGAI